MAYVVDPLNVSKPADSDFALVAAEEIRSLKASVTNRLAEAATAANTQLTTAISAITFKTWLELTGSGNFEVPAGVTKLLVIARGGGISGLLVRGAVTGFGGGAFGASVERADAAESSLIKTVTAGALLPYSVGVAGVLDVVKTGSTVRLYEATPAQATTFDGKSYPKASARLGLQGNLPAYETSDATYDPTTGVVTPLLPIGIGSGNGLLLVFESIRTAATAGTIILAW